MFNLIGSYFLSQSLKDIINKGISRNLTDYLRKNLQGQLFGEVQMKEFCAIKSYNACVKGGSGAQRMELCCHESSAIKLRRTDANVVRWATAET